MEKSIEKYIATILGSSAYNEADIKKFFEGGSAQDLSDFLEKLNKFNSPRGCLYLCQMCWSLGSKKYLLSHHHIEDGIVRLSDALQKHSKYYKGSNTSWLKEQAKIFGYYNESNTRI